ncbi:MAG TPA: glycosyltransferase family 39 protein [Acidobacteriaceae bacterium]|nr:glycosyltransferase family 39 protein [Acidobacteriaceae bacterium]
MMRRSKEQLPSFANLPNSVLPFNAVPAKRQVADAGIIQKVLALPSARFESASCSRSASDVSNFSLADRYPWTSFAILSALYLIVVACMSSAKLLWLDELITLHIAQLGSAGAIWHALSAGADPNPPATHLLVMIFRQLFGEHAFVVRLPATIGYWLGMLALFLFLKRRIPVLWALTGVVMSMAMGGFAWSYESRSYGIFYGLTMLAFYCWTQWADEIQLDRKRYIALAGMTFCLAMGLCTNFFAVLAFFPIAAALGVRTVQRIRGCGYRAPAESIFALVEWQVILALAIAATPLLLFHTLISSSIAHFKPYAWNKVGIDAAVGGYTDMLAEVLWLIFGLVVIALAIELLGNLRPEVQAKIWPRWLANFAANSSPVRSARLLDYPETAAVATLIAYPFLGYALASLHGGMLSARFVIPVCFGGAIAGALLAYRVFGSYRRSATIALTLTLLWFMARQSYMGYLYELQKEDFYSFMHRIPPPEYPGQPIAFGDDLLVLPLQYYAPPQLASRIVYPIDFPAIVRARHEASAEINMWQGRNTAFNFPILPLAAVQQSNATYLVLTTKPDWLVEDLKQHRYRVEALPIDLQAADLDVWGTPLAHSKPYLFRAAGDLATAASARPIPFNLSANLPQGSER